MPDLANIHIDVALTNVSIAYTNEEYNANDVFPVVPVPIRSNKYFVYNRDTFLRASGVDAQGKPSSIRRPNTRSESIVFDLSTLPYFCEQMAKNYPLTDAEVNYQDAPLNLDVDATEALTDMLMLDNEIQVANKVGKRANYASANKNALANGTTSWATGSAPKPMSVDFPAAKKAVITSLLRPPTHVLMNYGVCISLANTTEYVARLQYVSKESLTLAGLLPVVQGLKVVEARTQKVTSTEYVSTITSGYCWVADDGTDTALFYYNKGVPGLRSIAFGLTFDAPDDTLGAHNFAVKRWREEWIDATVIEVRTTRDWRFTATDGSSNGDNSNGYASGGYLLSSVLA